MKFKFLKAACAGLILSVSAFSNAGLITFNGTASDGDYTSLPGSYTEAGFTLTNNSGSNYFVDNDFSTNLNSWDDDVLEFNSLTSSQATLTADGNINFDFSSAFLGSFNSAASLTFEGFFAGGGSITQTFSLGLNTRALFNFTGFNNLSSLVISAPTDGMFALMDDLTVSASSVPEPSTLAIFALGIIGLASRRFKKQS
jgi:hypothetical protein